MSYTVRVLYWQADITLQIVPTKLTQLGLMLALIIVVLHLQVHDHYH